MTHHDLVLLAAYELQIQPEISAEQLAVQAWKGWPKKFGLAGWCDEYPDFNRVLVTLVGERGLIRRGYLERRGPKLYRLTSLGRSAAKQLLARKATA